MLAIYVAAYLLVTIAVEKVALQTKPLHKFRTGLNIADVSLGAKREWKLAPSHQMYLIVTYSATSYDCGSERSQDDICLQTYNKLNSHNCKFSIKCAHSCRYF